MLESIALALGKIFKIQILFLQTQIYKVNIKHLLVFLAPNIIFIGQLEKDIGRRASLLFLPSNRFLEGRRSNFKIKHFMVLLKRV